MFKELTLDGDKQDALMKVGNKWTDNLFFIIESICYTLHNIIVWQTMLRICFLYEQVK